MHTLVVGAARPSDFDDHVAAARRYVEYERGLSSVSFGGGGGGRVDVLREVEARLMAAYDAVWAAEGEGWREGWWVGVPHCYQVNTCRCANGWTSCLVVCVTLRLPATARVLRS